MRYISIKNVLGTIVNRLGTGNIQPSYYPAIYQYVVDAFRLLEVTTALAKKSIAIEICDNIGVLPCDYHEMIAVAHCGARVALGSDISDFVKQKGLRSFRDSAPAYNGEGGLPVFGPTGDSTGNIFGQPTNYVKLGDDSHIRSYYYRTEDNTIQTNMKDGTFELTYWAVPVDEDNYPLIPDKQSMMEALYWFAVMSLIGSGYKHSVFSYQDAEARWMQYEAKALGDLREWTPETAERATSLNHLVLPDYHKGFFINAERKYE
jgi:hypothetical protein